MRVNIIYVPVLNILLCALLLSDAFILPQQTKTVSIADFGSKLTRSGRRSSFYYYNYFLYTSDNSRYEIGKGLYDFLQLNDTIIIYSSPLINMPSAIHFSRENEMYISKIGQLHTKTSERVGLIGSLLFSIIIWIAVKLKFFKMSESISGLMVLTLFFSLVMFIFIIIEVCYV